MKYLIIFFVVFYFTNANAQVSNFFDDCESYTVGDYVAAKNSKWSTWSNRPGTDEDAMVSNERAKSGTKSIKLESNSSGGGPTDLILPFSPTTADVGVLEFEMYINVVGNTGTYFNFQGNNPVQTSWVFDAQFHRNGQFVFKTNNSATIVATGTYPQDEWFKFSCNIDLTLNIWKFFINDQQVCSFANPNNKIYCMDLFPLDSNGLSTAYVDDVKFTFTPKNLLNVDGTIVNAKIKPFGLINQTSPISIGIRNIGLDTINSFTVNYNDGSGLKSNQFTGQNIPSKGTKTVQLSDKVKFLSAQTPVQIYLTNVNGNTDQNKLNDTITTILNGYTPAANKKVLVEMGTSTTSNLGPKGIVLFDSLFRTYPDHFIPIAVHGNDPMSNIEYDEALFPLISGYPSAYVMRKNVFDPLLLELPSLEEISLAPNAVLANTTSFDSVTRELKVCVSTKFLKSVPQGYKLNCVLTESGVKGLSAGYAQRNAYASGTNGPMGGFENLPATVPSSVMVYDHVGRAILSGFDGTGDAYPDVIAAGDEYQFEFSYTVPVAYNIQKMNAISILLNEEGKVNNAESIKITNSINPNCKILIDNKDLHYNYSAISLSPNPIDDQTNIILQLNSENEISFELIDVIGAMKMKQNFGKRTSGKHILPLNLVGIQSGYYMGRIKIGTEFKSLALFIK